MLISLKDKTECFYESMEYSGDYKTTITVYMLMNCVSGIKSRYHGCLNTVLWEQQNTQYPKQENCTGEVYKKDTEKPHRS